MNTPEKQKKASIIIRAFNEEKYIEKLLLGIFSQKVTFEYEVILVDSGSTDKTLEIASNFDVKIISIASEDFSFGRSLNKGIENTEGEFCVFISAHCHPRDGHWLEKLLQPFSDETIALVYGKQRGNHITKFPEQQIFIKWFPDESTGRQKTIFCNNANAAIRRSIWEANKFNETLTGLEDLDWAKNVIPQGYCLYYAHNAPIVHVHDETYNQTFQRYKREAIAMKKIYSHESFSLFDFFKLYTLNILSDYLHAATQKVLFQNIMVIPVMRFAQLWGTYKGYKYDKVLTRELRNKFYYPVKPGLINKHILNNKDDKRK